MIYLCRRRNRKIWIELWIVFVRGRAADELSSSHESRIFAYPLGSLLSDLSFSTTKTASQYTITYSLCGIAIPEWNHHLKYI
mmetsp:Transcript_38525/g.67647  ORF Transcript_38525/g.67647 Transcript_38525/m.67647 type:complete len:82 (-) Transcript_38525:65-310(-)